MKKQLAVVLFALSQSVIAGPFPAPGQCARIVEIPIQLENGWENYGSPMKPATFYKDCYGVVRLAGGVRNGTTTAAFRLPAGYRPEGHEIFPAATTSYRNAAVYITAEGYVDIVGTSDYVSLSGITFRAAN